MMKILVCCAPDYQQKNCSTKNLFFKLLLKFLAPCPWVILNAYLSFADFFSKLSFSKNSFRNIIIVSTVWMEIRPDKVLVLIWVQTVCKGYQYTTLGGLVNMMQKLIKFFFDLYVAFVYSKIMS